MRKRKRGNGKGGREEKKRRGKKLGIVFETLLFGGGSGKRYAGREVLQGMLRQM